MKKITLITILTLFVLPAMAGTVSVELSHKVDSDAKVLIELISGTIRVIGTSGNEIRVRGTVNDEWETVEIHGGSSDVTIEVKVPRGRHRNMKLSADLEISVPSGVDLSFESVSTELTLEGLTDAVSIESVSGDIEIRGDMRELTIESISGNIDVEAGRSMENVEIEITSGNINWRGDLNPGGDYSFSAVSGIITLWVPEGTSADYEIEVFSGSISNEFGPSPQKSEMLPSQSLSFTVGSGSADVEIETFSGKVRLKKQ